MSLINWLKRFRYRVVREIRTTRKRHTVDDGGFGWVKPSFLTAEETGTEIVYENGFGKRKVKWIPDLERAD